MSAIGSRETSISITDQLSNQYNISSKALLYRDKHTTPTSYIIHSHVSDSRTIISDNNMKDIAFDEFVDMYNCVYKENHPEWIHFEGRNISETVLQIKWLHKKAVEEGWRDALTISVEVEKPNRDHIEDLIPMGDVIFFSKLFAQKYGYDSASSFLSNKFHTIIKPKAIMFCTWGSKEAAVYDNHTQDIYSLCPPRVDQVVDSVGAGDTFIAGIIRALSCLSDLRQALAYGCRLASAKVTQHGFDIVSNDPLLSSINAD
ncbi:Ribokinase-like protein [Pilobolus umbonatus]|nr:Ribokinase-like protein [Pilobolus umbonatus]